MLVEEAMVSKGIYFIEGRGILVVLLYSFLRKQLLSVSRGISRSFAGIFRRIWYNVPQDCLANQFLSFFFLV